MKILLVDDNELHTKILANTLRTQGYDVTEALSGEEASSAIEKERFELAIVDWNLPGPMTGIQIGRAIRKMGIATFMISGYSKEYIRSEWRDPLEGFVQFFSKPVDRQELLDAIERIRKSTEETEP